ncbi:MAG: hypothetical protein M0R74_20095 [Dehalococcoidia bacterium]|nr:hypothetical protein [Dehalococcoidia bacterium]
MNFLNSRRKALLFGAPLLGALILVAIMNWQTGEAGTPRGEPVVTDPQDAPPPAAWNPFIMDGRFYVAPYDDRHLSDEQKVAALVYNPAWKPFGQCMEEKAVEVRADRSVPLSQQDLDRLVERLNREYPDAEKNKLIPLDPSGYVTGDAEVFLRCAEQWLTKSAKEIAEITGEPNEYWPLPTATENP